MAGRIYYGLSDLTEPLAYAAAHLQTEADRLESDTRYFRYREKVGIDDIRQLLALLGLASDGFAVMFDQAETLNVNCQNALLKDLEDRDDILFIFVSKQRLLPTVESRSVVVWCQPMSIEDFRKENPGLSDGWYYITGGNPDLLEKAKGDEAIGEIVYEAENDITGFISDKKKLLSVFGQMREKDKSNFFDLYKDFIPGLYDMFCQLLLADIDRAGALDALDELERHKELMRRSNSYGKNDFLDCLISI
ncbi:MAG: hypothetical protein IKS98_13135 [Lachnospiraceae bacterium]|nr:hypothetical protein [Lachnospiraceae bacterium]